MAGRALRGMLSTADYKGGKALKSCHTEFVHIYSAAFSNREEDLRRNECDGIGFTSDVKK